MIHRDRALDGSAILERRPIQEVQADKFAAYFLMPSKLVENSFYEAFFMEKFFVSDETIFSLTRKGIKEFEKTVKSKRDLSRLLSSTDYFGGKYFTPLSKKFEVSEEAMAIRLEELDLVDY